MASNKKSVPSYDLNAQTRKRDMAVRLGLTAALLGTTALVAAPAMAQSGSAGQGLGEIVVTAS